MGINKRACIINHDQALFRILNLFFSIDIECVTSKFLQIYLH